MANLTTKNIRTWALRLFIAAAALASATGLLLSAFPGNSSEPAANLETNEHDHKYEVVIHQPDGHPKVFTGRTNMAGEAVTVSCSTCHSTTTPNPAIRSSEQLQQFHQGLEFNHGTLSCLSCHNSENYDTLRLADGSPVAFKEVMSLCAQCHGTQTRDYQKGSHGGMTGHWDLSKGGRHRNNCTDCHDPHHPAFPQVMPVFEPIDRAPVKGMTNH